VFCALPPAPPRPPPPWAAGATTTQTGWLAACCPPAMVPSWRRRCAGRRHCCRRGEEREGGAVRRLAEFLAGRGGRRSRPGGIRRGGRGSARAGGRGGRQRRWSRPERAGSQGRGASLGMAGDSDGWGPDDRASDAPPIAFQKGGVFLPPPVDHRGPVDGNDTVRIRRGRVIGVISRG
jgi:hypothetical protein